MTTGTKPEPSSRTPAGAEAPSELPRSRPVLGKVAGLDGIRGLGILLVLAYHVSFGFGVAPGRIVPGGFVGVDMFFVLSGFLITALLLEERHKRSSISFRAFYLRRAYRLLPALVLLLGAHLVFALVVGNPLKAEIKGLAYVTFYVSNWAQVTHHAVPRELDPTWSLAIEEQFYLVWPLALVLLTRYVRKTQLIVAILGGAALISAGLRRYYWTQGITYPDGYMRTDMRADSLLIGAIVSFLWWEGWLPKSKRAAFGVGIAGLAGLLAAIEWGGIYEGFFYAGGFTLVALAAAAVVASIVTHPTIVSTVFSLRPLAALGRISYGLYLWQNFWFALVLFHILPDGSKAAKILLSLVLIFGTSLASWFLVERPFLRLKGRWARSSSSAAIPTLAVTPAQAPL